jgi:serine/threonine protein kinase
MSLKFGGAIHLILTLGNMSNYQINELKKRLVLNNGIMTVQAMDAIWRQMGNHDQELLTRLLHEGWINTNQAKDIQNKVSLYLQHLSNSEMTPAPIAQDAVPTARVHSEQVPESLKLMTQLPSADDEPTMSLLTNQIQSNIEGAFSQSNPEARRYPTDPGSSSTDSSKTVVSQAPPAPFVDSERHEGDSGYLEQWLEPTRRRKPEAVGPYKVVSEQGRGGMSIVYQARLSPNSELIALKVLTRKGLMASGGLLRFEREASAIRRMRHPNIIRVHDATFTDELSYIAMELLKKGSLEEQLLAEGPLPIRKAVQICEKVANALQHAHEQKIIHRDLKPANILLTDRGEPVVADFGVAKLRDISQFVTLSKQGEILGTPGYMSPEQADGCQDEIDARSDVYSLGATLYALLAGRPPFVGGSVAKVLTAVVSDAPKSPRLLREDIPADLERVILCCLEKDPEKRVASAALLAKILHNWLDSRDGDASLDRVPVAAVKKKPEEASSNSRGRWLPLVFCAIFGALFLWSEWRHQRSDLVDRNPRTNRNPGTAVTTNGKEVVLYKGRLFSDRLEELEYLLGDNYLPTKLFGTAKSRNSTLSRSRTLVDSLELGRQSREVADDQLFKYYAVLLRLLDCELDIAHVNLQSFAHARQCTALAKNILAMLKTRSREVVRLRQLEAQLLLREALYAHFILDLPKAQDTYRSALKLFDKTQPQLRAFCHLCVGQIFVLRKSWPQAQVEFNKAQKTLGAVEKPARSSSDQDLAFRRCLLSTEICEFLARTQLKSGDDKGLILVGKSINLRNVLARSKSLKAFHVLSLGYEGRARTYSNQLQQEREDYLKSIANRKLAVEESPIKTAPYYFELVTSNIYSDFLISKWSQAERALPVLDRALESCERLLKQDQENLAYLIELAILEFHRSQAFDQLKRNTVNKEKYEKQEQLSRNRCRKTLQSLFPVLPESLLPKGAGVELEEQISKLKTLRYSPLLRRSCGVLD